MKQFILITEPGADMPTVGVIGHLSPCDFNKKLTDLLSAHFDMNVSVGAVDPEDCRYGRSIFVDLTNNPVYNLMASTHDPLAEIYLEFVTVY